MILLPSTSNRDGGRGRRATARAMASKLALRMLILSISLELAKPMAQPNAWAFIRVASRSLVADVNFFESARPSRE